MQRSGLIVILCFLKLLKSCALLEICCFFLQLALKQFLDIWMLGVLGTLIKCILVHLPIKDQIHFRVQCLFKYLLFIYVRI